VLALKKIENKKTSEVKEDQTIIRDYPSKIKFLPAILYTVIKKQSA